MRLLILLTVLALAGCQTTPTPAPAPAEAPPEPASVVHFADRAIDIAPHVAGFPYRSFKPYPELNVLLYMHEGETRQMMKLPLDGDLDLASGTPVNDIDWNSRNLRALKPLPAENALMVLADADNQEFYDVYKLHLDDGRFEKITDVPYIYGWGLDAAKEKVNYIARYPIDGTETFKSCLERMSVGGGEAEQIICDDPERTFTWGSVDEEDGTFLLRANLENDRGRAQLLRLAITDAGNILEPLTPDLPRSMLGVLDHRLDDGRFVAINDETGFGNLFTGSFDGGALAPLTAFDEAVNDAYLLKGGDVTYAVATIRRPHETEILVIDAAGAVLHRTTVEANLYGLEATATEAWFYETSRASKMDVVRLTLGEGGVINRESRLGMPAELAASLVHCDIERVQIPTFDVDPATGETRLLHAYLSTPRVAPAEGQRRLAAIVAFYGGGNAFDTRSQIFCQGGITSVSPAVRGSWGFGREFYSLNDGDLGGDEIVDVQHVAKWLEAEHGFEARDIGTHGGSHGGYATMRSLTFPPETNGRDSAYDFGWGISFYGFSDIKTFWETCNIPDWVLLEAGDPATEPEKIAERSPLHHVDLLTSPILLLHGENDQRVPVQESRQFAEACKAANKDCPYIEFAGQGHGLKGLTNQVRVYQEVFNFLSRVATTSAP
jgi:dienelactone hydrolase